MPTSFEPDEPHPPARQPRERGGIYALGVLSALSVLMIFALFAPRWFGNTALNWALTLGASVLTLVTVIGLGMAVTRPSP